MKKILLFIIPLFISIIVFVVLNFFINSDSGKGALQVTSIPKSQVLLDGKLIGQTPLCKCESIDMISVGEHTLKLIPQDLSFAPYQEKIKINKSVLTVVDRAFSNSISSEGSTITLEKNQDQNKTELLVISFPQDSDIFLDGNSVGRTPFSTKDITSSDHEIKVAKKGYREKISRIHTVSGYKLIATVSLIPDPSIDNSITKPASAPASAKVSKVTILETPTGFLRVREENNLNSAEIGRVNPGELFELKDEKDGWFQIKLKDGKLGWISNEYAKKEESSN